MKVIKKLDFNFRISQKLKLPYYLYADKNSDALKLLESLRDTNDFSLEWDHTAKSYSLIIYINLFGQKFSDLTIRGVIVRAFQDLYLSGE